MRALLALLALLMAAPAPAAPVAAAVRIGPQPGPQTLALSSTADIVVMGGAAGGGKTFAELLEPVRHLDNPNFGCVIFRRTFPQIENEGGLWDEAGELYPHLGGKPNENKHRYDFPSGASIRFSHLQHLKDVYAWKGAQIPFIGFDQLEEFEEKQFWYMLSRLRSARAGIRPYVFATVNPVPEDDPVGGWVNRLLAWWIDQDTGYAIPERSGVLRWFVRINDTIHWADTRKELLQRFPTSRPKSLTFILAKLDDNAILNAKDPAYRSNLEALSYVERERLLGGNWKIKESAGLIFNRAWFKTILAALPTDILGWVRYWDKAGTQDGGKYSAGVLMAKRAGGRFIVVDVVRGQWSSLNRETVIQQTATFDRARGNVLIWVEQEPGSGGKESAENTIRNLAGFTIHAERVTGDKVTRAGPLSAQVEAGNVDLLQASWNEAFLSECQNFDGVHGFMDQVDAASGAFNKLTGAPKPPSMVNAKTGQRIS